jgi:3-deoxy-D-manno-octulosonic-acid transferase
MREWIWYLTYVLLANLVGPIALVRMGLRCLGDREYRGGWRERLGFVPRRGSIGQRPCVWVHAVSAGETVAAAPVVSELRKIAPEADIVISNTTPAGRRVAIDRRLSDTSVFYLPFDWLPGLWLAWRNVRPDVLVIFETEVWPNLVTLFHTMGTRIVLANGRVADQSWRRKLRVRPLFRWTLSRYDALCVQGERDAERIAELGGCPDRVLVLGSTKFDQVAQPVSGAGRAEDVFVAGSTHPGEEEIVLDAFAAMRNRMPSLKMILAPRHTARAGDVEALCTQRGFTVARRSQQDGAVRIPDQDILLLDTVGELTDAYGLGKVCVVGGSFCEVGGHNILEPIAWGRPALFGPNMANFRDIRAIAMDAGVGFEAHTVDELADLALRLLADGEALAGIGASAEQMFARHRGASARCAQVVAEQLPGAGDRP